MLVYDITNEKSFDNIRNWIRNIEEVRQTLGCYKKITLSDTLVPVISRCRAHFLVVIVVICVCSPSVFFVFSMHLQMWNGWFWGTSVT